MAITDLLDRVPFPPRERPERAAAAPRRPFEIELPIIERVGIPLPDDPPAVTGAPVGASSVPTGETAGASGPAPAQPPEAPARASAVRPPMPSYAFLVIGGLTLLSLALAAALALSDGAPRPASEAGTAPAAVSTAPATVRPTSARPRASFLADPTPIPVDLLTRLEDASAEPLDVELGRLLDAVGHGFGSRSAQLEPTLRSYVYRVSGRLERSPDTFRVAATAPEPALASARADLLKQIFRGATASGRLQVGAGVGPHALTLVSE